MTTEKVLKGQGKTPAPKAVEAPKETPKAAEADVLVVKIVAQPPKPFRGNSARAAYWDRFCEYDGKPLSELEESCHKDAPSFPKRGPGAGKPEAFSGWLSFFKQCELLSTPTKK